MDNNQPLGSNSPIPGAAPAPADSSNGPLYGINNNPSELPKSINTEAVSAPVSPSTTSSPVDNTANPPAPSINPGMPGTAEPMAMPAPAPAAPAEPVNLSSTVSVIPASGAVEQPASPAQSSLDPNPIPPQPQPVTPSDPINPVSQPASPAPTEAPSISAEPTPAPVAALAPAPSQPEPFVPPATVGGGLPEPTPGEVQPGQNTANAEPVSDKKGPAKHAKTLMFVIIGAVLLIATVGVILIMAGVFA